MPFTGSYNAAFKILYFHHFKLREGPWDNRDIESYKNFYLPFWPLEKKEHAKIPTSTNFQPSVTCIWMDTKGTIYSFEQGSKNLITNFSIFRKKWVNNDSGR